MQWDLFCHVVDNFGDIGVCWRLAADLASRGQTVRLWVDDGQALAWMAPGALQAQWPGVTVWPWSHCSAPDAPAHLQHLPPADVWVEAFGCDIPAPFLAHYRAGSAAHKPPVWINLEYLSAEPYVERCHGLPSPVMQGPAQGLTKYFFYPGFTPLTGGLLREPTLNVEGQAPSATQRAEFVQQLGCDWQGERLLSLFCYEPPLLPHMLQALAAGQQDSLLLVTPGRAAQAVRAVLGGQTTQGHLHLHYLPALPQTGFDQLLRHCDVNFVRGEDSLVRALWAGRPMVWQIYPQEDAAHAAKLEAFLQQLQWSPVVCALHRAWNDLAPCGAWANALQALDPALQVSWQAEVQTSRARLLEMPDLVSQLLQFVEKKS